MAVLQSVGNYDLLEKIAEGGMGAIYRGRNRATGQIVAVKVMPPHTASNPVLLKRFEQEFRAASRLDHPNIVRALDFGDAGNMPYLVMEFVEGISLGQKIDQEGRIPETEAIRIIAQVAQGLHRAHKLNLIHRDVKPDNILITPDGIAKLADLGLVKETETELNLTRTGRGLGTPHFMAPEQFRNAKNADVRCDIYSLGATLYMMVTGELPFRSNGPLDAWMKKIQGDLTPPRALVPSLSERVDWAILRAMKAEKEERPATCREFVEDLTGHSTRRVTYTGSGNSVQDLWYLVYKDEEGTQHTVKGNTTAIRRSLRDGHLGDASNVRASRSKAGPFEELRGFPEFRDIVLGGGAQAQRGSGQRPSNPVIPSGSAGSAPAESNAPAPPVTPDKPPSAPYTEGAESAASASGSGPVPRIDLRSVAPADGSLEWLKWLLLFALAMLAGATLAYWFLPRPQ
jgi:serine/threonine protein kinase